MEDSTTNTTETKKGQVYQARSVAKLINLSSLKEGIFVQGQGYDPSYVDTEFGKISRINLIGIVISKSVIDNLIEVDDGTNRIKVRKSSLNNDNDYIDLNGLNLGTIVNIIGKVRQYNQEFLIIPEIVKKITEPKWMEVRKIEISKLTVIKKIEKTDYVESIEIKTNDEENTNLELNNIEVSEDLEETKSTDGSINEQIINHIRDLDDGNGANIDEIVTKINHENANELITKLLEHGEIFEIRPGKIKVLE